MRSKFVSFIIVCSKNKNISKSNELPEKFVSNVVGTHDGIRGAHNPFEHKTRVSPNSLYKPKSLQRACNE